MMKKVHIVIKIISFYYIGSCMAQSGDWEYFDVSDGLASNNVRAIAVDGDNIWFGTFGGGLSRYKKSTNIWETFDLSDSLSNMVSAVTVEGNHIWIGTDLGVGRFNKNTKELKYWSHIQCISDVVIDYNEVWCSTFGKGVYRYTKANGMWTHFDTTNCELLSNVVSDLGIQGDKIWCATKAGVSSYDRSSNNWQNYTPDNCQIAGNDLFSLEIDGNTIWFGHVPMPVNPDTIGSYSYTHTSTIYYYSNCTQMVLTEGKIWPSIIRFPSISQFQTHQNKWEYYECVWIDNSSDEKYSYLVSDIAADNESVWFASVGRGVFKLDKSTGIITNFNTTNSNLIEDYIWTIAVDGNYIWVGTSEKGVCRYRMSTSLWKCYQLDNGLPDETVQAIGVYGDEAWIGMLTGGIISYLQISTGSFTYYDMNANSLGGFAVGEIEVDSQYVWISSSTREIVVDTQLEWYQPRLVCYDKKTEGWEVIDTTKSKLGNSGVFSIVSYGDEVWFGAGNGKICSYHKLSDTWSLYDSLVTGVNCDIWDIDVKDDELWFTTESEGVGYFNTLSDKWLHFDTTDGLCHNVVTSVGIDDENVWFGTFGGGISCYNKLKEEWITIDSKNIGILNPYIDYISVLAIDGENIWFGTFYPGVYRYNKSSGIWDHYNNNNSPLRAEINCWVHDIEVEDPYVWIATYDTQRKDFPSIHYETTGSLCRYGDVIPPNLVHTPVIDDKPSEQIVLIIASINDNLTVKSGHIFYRKGGTIPYDSTDLRYHTGDLWVGEIPGFSVSPGTMEYYLSATDGRNRTTHPYSNAQNSPHRFQIYDSVPPYGSISISSTAEYISSYSTLHVNLSINGTGSDPEIKKLYFIQYADYSTKTIVDSIEVTHLLNIDQEELNNHIYSLAGTFNIGILESNTLAIKMKAVVKDQGHNEKGDSIIVKILSNALPLFTGSITSVARISYPDSMAVVTGLVQIRGSAYSDSLKQYMVGYLDSLNQYQIIHSSLKGKEDGILANWNTEGLPEGRYILSLEVENINGSKNHHHIPVVLDTTRPRCEILNVEENMVLGGYYGIVGTACDRHFDIYFLEYGEGVNPQEWQIVGGIYSNSVIEDTLGIWNTHGMNGYYSLRLYAKDDAGLERTDLRVVILDNKGAHARISSPGVRDIITQEAEIRGSVVDDNLKSYRVEYSPVSNSLNWTEVESDTMQVMNGVLARWNTVGLNGDYLIRLTAVDRNNHIERDSVMVIVDNLFPVAEITWPKESAKIGGIVSITGTAFDANFLEYVLEYGQGENPEVWTRTTGTRFSSPVFSDLLGEWNTEEKLGIYCLRLSVSDSCGYQSDDRIVVDITSEIRAKEGGCIVSSDGFMELCLSPNSMPDNTHITINPIEMTAYPSLGIDDLLASVYHIAPVDLDLTKPGLLRIHYSEEVLSDMEDERRLAIARYCEEDSLWKSIGGTMETESWCISCAVDQLGWYSLIEDKTVGGNHEIGGISIQPRIFSPRGGVYANETQVMFDLGRDSDVTVKIFNVAGRLIQTLCENQFMTNGSNTLPWDGKDHHGGYCVSGMYVVVIQAEDKRATKTVMVLNQ